MKNMSIHYGVLLGHSALRIAVMGFVNRDPDAQELEQLKATIENYKSQIESLRAMSKENVEHVPYYAEAHDVPLVQQSQAYHLQSQDSYEHVLAPEEYVEEVMSLENAEKELIRKALIRSRGRRKVAAQELKISERTLYRKIKEYNLEEY